jgi:hypothetical protein
MKKKDENLQKFTQENNNNTNNNYNQTTQELNDDQYFSIQITIPSGK